MAELITVPHKKPADVDVIGPLKNLFAANYSSADNPEDYTDQINEFSKLRSNAVWRSIEKTEASLEVIYGYYDQLCALQDRIPATEVQIPFKWKDAFNKGSLFGGRISHTVNSLIFEKACVMFNIAALQSHVAASQSLENDDGLKLAAKLLQLSAGIFSALKHLSSLQTQPFPSIDLHPDVLQTLSSLMLAQAQEIFVHKALHDNMKDAIAAKLCAQADEYYAEVMKHIQKEACRNIWDSTWLPLISGKQAAFHGLAEYFQSLVCKQNKSIGEEIARLQKSMELFKAAQSRSGKPLFQDFIGKVQRNLAEAEKDNNFIYHERIPSNLEPIPKAAIAKIQPLPSKLSAKFKDIFENLVPMSVHQALAAYDVRKSELVNTEISKLRENTQFLNSVLASLNLPAALEDTTGVAVPPSVIEKSQAVQASGGIEKLDRMMRELPDLLQRNKEILDETDRMLNEERDADNQLRSQFGERWTRIDSDKLTTVLRSNAAKYRQIIDNAISADKIVRDKYEKNRNGMTLLSQGPASIEAVLPASASGSCNSSAASQLRALMEEVETMKATRDVIEMELKSASTDMKAQFLNALSEDGSINEASMSEEILSQSYGPLKRQVQETLSTQESLLAQIQKANTEFSKEKNCAQAATQRENMLKDIAAAYDTFYELQRNLEEGTKFYNDLTAVLVTFQNKVSDFCFARKTEKEELLKDLTKSLGRDAPSSAPEAPAHHEAAKQTQPMPPAVPSSNSNTLPYPTMPQGMPQPYAPVGAAPYPTYAVPQMPQSYNPYATLPYPRQPPPGYAPQGYPPQPGYPMQQQYPQYPPQQPPPQW
nr:PREDICTED: programmed cell death 6-interacting protein [Bemisia tabaci]